MAIYQDTFTLSNGVSIPKIGFGTSPLKGDEAYNAVKDALKAGYRHIDTAQIYQNETEVGKAIHDSGIPRNEIFITTKLDASVKNEAGALKAFEGSLKRLKVDYVDLYLIHAPWPWEEKYANYDKGNVLAFNALIQLEKSGKARAVGVSNFSVNDLENIKKHCEFMPRVNQIKLHIGHPQTDIVNYCKAHDILVEAYSPLGRAKVLNHETITQAAEQLGVSNAQLCVRYPLEKGILPLPRSSKPKHIIANRSVDFTIDKKIIDMLDALSIDSIEFGTPIKTQK